MNYNCLIIVESIYNNNTMKLARAMAQTLGCLLISVDQALTMDLNSYQTIGLGSGIYFGRHHPKIFEIVEKFNFVEQNVFIFSSRGNPFLGKYHKPLKNALLDKNKKIMAEFSVCGYDETGPWVIIGGGHKGKPNEKDLRKAVRFIQKEMPQYCMPDYYLQIKNKQPIREGLTNFYCYNTNGTSVLLCGDRVTFNHNNCNGCGKCAKVCPLEIIHIEKNKALSKNELDCTLCRLCVINCNQRAINLHYSWLDSIKVAKRHSKRTSLYLKQCK
ncbi:MAG: 4Fe-4S binding protein [Bacteroidales bacterium]|nr:4Fe-4S binding protein [Bacteroidales bacterium]